MRAIGPNSFPEEDNELLHTPLFKQVSPEQANELIPYLHEAVFDKGDYIFREGDRDHRMYLLERGRVKLIRESKDRRVQLLSIHAATANCSARFPYSTRPAAPVPPRPWR